jgi:hypothetical protein
MHLRTMPADSANCWNVWDSVKTVPVLTKHPPVARPRRWYQRPRDESRGFDSKTAACAFALACLTLLRHCFSFLLLKITTQE